MCNFDKYGELGCLSCGLADCNREDILDDAFIEEPPPEKDNTDSFCKDRFKEKGKRQYIKYKGTYFDDRRHQRAREYGYNKRHGIKEEPRVFKQKGREREYQREYRAQMPPEQREKYLAKQREYNKKRRARAKQTL